MANKAFIRYDSNGRIIGRSLIIKKDTYPGNGIYKEVPMLIDDPNFLCPTNATVGGDFSMTRTTGSVKFSVKTEIILEQTFPFNTAINPIPFSYETGDSGLITIVTDNSYPCPIEFRLYNYVNNAYVLLHENTNIAYNTTFTYPFTLTSGFDYQIVVVQPTCP